MSDDAIYIDETGFNLHLRRKFAIYNGRLVHFRSKVGSYNSNEFIQFLTQTFERTGTGQKHLVMDNVRFHHTENVKNTVESRGHDIIFLPPYSPQLNPIELLFSKWKSIVKADMKIFISQDILQVIQRVCLQITPENCQGWIRESTRFVSMALRKETF
ncbi:hypothetical protein RF11_09239 [Thelohanellus kitauei]|uniref:Tc1-like transposase DDE domain-containing protein n=1 Tax=Thelohanellus kitauei TaxID=669202 RepID=A0A0C2N4F0_THEKT|nr:hypothetical protein RF11_09239 [Thelohanellus kitauei]